jgi:hypothetical protein
VRPGDPLEIRSIPPRPLPLGALPLDRRAGTSDHTDHRGRRYGLKVSLAIANGTATGKGLSRRLQLHGILYVYMLQNAL